MHDRAVPPRRAKEDIRGRVAINIITTECYRCGAEIHFDPAIRSKNGKAIPLAGKAGTRKHNCPASPFSHNRRAGKKKRQQKGSSSSKSASRRLEEELNRLNMLLQELMRRTQVRDSATAFAVLGLPPNCKSVAEVKKAYRERALAYHPDRNSDDPKASEKFRRIQEAYEKCLKVLS